MFEALQVHITDDCNLSCPYCFNLKRSTHYLAANKILIAINDLFGERKNDFFLHFIGGEPLLYWDEIKDVLRSIWINRDFIPNHSITTNGKNINAQIINEFKILNTKITLSIEGRKERHQALRIPFSDTDYHNLLQNTQLLLRTIGSNNVIARLTLYRDLWDVTDEVEFLISKGIRHFKILPDLNISPDHCVNALAKLNHKFSQKIIDGQISIFPLNDQLLPNTKLACGVGESIICIAPDENFYPCHRFVYHKELILGNITNGLKQNALNEWSNGMQQLRKVCNLCPNVNRCNFPCPYPDRIKMNENWCNWMGGITNNYI